MRTIDRQTLKSKLDSNEVMLVDVLKPEHYDKFHIPGAINVPLGDDFEEKIQEAVPRKDREVVVYCYDDDCDASPKAAQQMEQLGYSNVLDYEAGKMDWKSAGLPVQS